jgi:hypothetical protein
MFIRQLPPEILGPHFDGAHSAPQTEPQHAVHAAPDQRTSLYVAQSHHP